MTATRRGRRRDPSGGGRDPGPGAWEPLLPWALALVPVVLGTLWAVDAASQVGRLAFPMDDPYIHLQFARNLARGDGFAFNPGEPTPGATSPLWVIVLALGALLRVPLGPFALVLGMLAAAAATWLTWDVGRRAGLGIAAAALAALGVGLTGRFVWASLSGMETCLAATLALIVVRLQLAGPVGLRRAAFTGIAVGLAAQARPEMLLLAPLAAFTEWRAAPPAGKAPPPFARAAVVLGLCAAVVAPYVVFCLATTGRPLPNTFYAKSLLQLAGPDLAALRAAYLPGMLSWMWRDNVLFALLVVPGFWAWTRVRRGAGAALVPLWPLAFWIYALALYPRHFSLSRYTIPLVPFVALLAAAPLDLLVRRLGDGARRAVIVAATVVLLASAAWQTPQAAAVYRANVTNIVRMHLAMSDWIRAHLPEDARVAMNDVGALTWYGGRYCIDTVGLVSGDFIGAMLERRRHDPHVSAEAVLPDYFVQARPDYCVLFPAWYPNLTAAPWLREIHRVSWPNSTGGGNDLVVYQVLPRAAAGADPAGP